MALRVYIFEEDVSMLTLLTLFLQGRGHQVSGFPDRYSCPLHQMEACACPADAPCAEALIIGTRHPSGDSLQILCDQERKGCKLISHNKAIMSAVFTEEQEQRILNAGYSVIKKPFRLAGLETWLDACAERIKNTGFTDAGQRLPH